MKREARNHHKFKLLAKDLGISLCYARGVMESLWLAAGESAPRGDVGRWSNEEIAIAMDYDGDAEALVEALIKRRLLDQIPEADGRLYVHDWHEHADDAVQLKLVRAGLTFANGAKPKSRRMARAEREKHAHVDQAEQDAVRESSAQCAHAVRTPCTLPEPEPEPEPEPVTIPLPPSGGAAPNGTWKTDESYQPFVEAYRQSGAAVIDEDFADAWWAWKVLDHEQRLARTKAFTDRLAQGAYGDPAYIPKPRRFIEREWKRPIVVPRRGGKSKQATNGPPCPYCGCDRVNNIGTCAACGRPRQVAERLAAEMEVSSAKLPS